MPSSIFSSLTLVSRKAALSRIAARPTYLPVRRFAQGYGGGEGDPKGENPQDQGSSNDTKQHAEHPGPAPVSEGQGTGAGPTKGGSGKTPEDSSAQSGGSRSKEAKETGSSPIDGSVKNGGESSSPENKSKSKDGAGPKIHDKDVPEPSGDEKAEVKKHNREFEQGHDRAPKAEEDKVDEKF